MLPMTATPSIQMRWRLAFKLGINLCLTKYWKHYDHHDHQLMWRLGLSRYMFTEYKCYTEGLQMLQINFASQNKNLNLDESNIPPSYHRPITTIWAIFEYCFLAWFDVEVCVNKRRCCSSYHISWRGTIPSYHNPPINASSYLVDVHMEYLYLSVSRMASTMF